jgi:hypothetical protein
MNIFIDILPNVHQQMFSITWFTPNSIIIYILKWCLSLKVRDICVANYSASDAKRVLHVYLSWIINS